MEVVVVESRLLALPRPAVLNRARAGKRGRLTTPGTKASANVWKVPERAKMHHLVVVNIS